MYKQITNTERRVVSAFWLPGMKRVTVTEMKSKGREGYHQDLVMLSLAELRKVVRVAEMWADWRKISLREQAKRGKAKQPAKRAAKQATGRDSNL